MEVAARTDADKKGGPETLGLETGLSLWGPAYFQGVCMALLVAGSVIQ